jgi:hypothetical protein
MQGKQIAGWIKYMLLSPVSMFVNSFACVIVPYILLIITSNLSLNVGKMVFLSRLRSDLTCKTVMNAYFILVSFFMQKLWNKRCACKVVVLVVSTDCVDLLSFPPRKGKIYIPKSYVLTTYWLVKLKGKGTVPAVFMKE